MNKTTQTIRQLALDQYRYMSWSDEQDIYRVDPQNFLTEMAESLVSMEMDGSDEKTGEMFPEWCSLVLTPAIAQTIDWECVRAAVIEMYEEEWVDDMFGA